MLKNKLNRIISTVVKKDKCKFKIDYRVSGEAFYTKPNKEIYMAKKIIKKITNISTKFNCRGGTSDSRFLGAIPRLELGLRNNTIHMVDERTSVSDLKKLTKIYYNILENYSIDIKEINRIKTENVDAELLKNAKAKYVGNFIRRIENPQVGAKYAVDIKLNDLPKDFYETYLEKINAVSAEDVKGWQINILIILMVLELLLLEKEVM